MENSKSKRDAHHVMTTKWRGQVKLEPRCGVQIMTTRTWLLDFEHMGLRVCQLTCWGSRAVCGRCSGSGWSRCHWSHARFHRADVIQSTDFFLDFVVHLCTCSQTVFCDRQFSSVANYCTFASRTRVIWGLVFTRWISPSYLGVGSATYVFWFVDSSKPKRGRIGYLHSQGLYLKKLLFHM